MNKPINKKKRKKLQNFILTFSIILILAAIPALILNYQSQLSGMNISEVLKRKFARNFSGGNINEDRLEAGRGGKVDFLSPSAIGLTFSDPPLISNILPCDLDKDGLNDIVVCDAGDNFVSWIRQNPKGVFTEKVIADNLIAPAHTQVVDFDSDGDNDVLVAVLGMLFPNNDKIGSVIILENDGSCNFIKHIVADKIARVSDVRAGDLDNDKDMDLAVAQFGYDDGETRWIENQGSWKFKSHILQKLSGPINVEITDIEGDGDSDIVSIASQEWEEIYCFVNDGKGSFRTKLIWGSENEDFGSSGILVSDLDQDGDPDIIYTNGDAFDYIPPVPRPWHGVNWLENKGNIEFEYHRICDFAGAYNARPVDADKDGDLDLFVVSGFNLWNKPETQSFIWLENDGKMKFTMHDITGTPTHLLTLESCDFNNDGLTDFVTGGMHAYPPYDRMGRITLWLNTGLKK
jgi:hypothetical protein